MDVYWELSDYDINTRKNGIDKLIQTVQNKETENMSSEIDYATNRLIKGLVSNRKCARIGYASALGTLVSFDGSTDDILQRVQNALSTKTQTFIEDIKNVTTGRILSYIALAYNQKDDLSSVLPKILPDILTMRRQAKHKLQAFIDSAIIQLSKWAGKKLFKKEIFSQINSLLPTSWIETLNNDSKSIYLLVSLSNTYPKIFDQTYYQSRWKENVLPLSSSKEHANIKKCLQSFGNELHLLQTLCQEIILYSLRTQQFEHCWTLIAEELSNNGLESNKGHILLESILFCFEQEDETNIITDTILNDSVFVQRILLLSMSNKGKSKQAAAHELAKSVVSKLSNVITKKSIDQKLKIFGTLLNCTKNYACLQSTTKAISDKLTADESIYYAKYLIGLFCENEVERIDDRRQFIINLLINLASDNDDVFEQILLLFVLFAYFKTNRVPKNLRDFLPDVSFEISDRLREYIGDGIYKLILHEFSKHQFMGCFHVFKRAASWCDKETHYTPYFKYSDEIKSYLAENYQQLYETVNGTIIQALPDEKLRISFQQVFVLGLFDLFVNYRQAKQCLEDLVTCIENAHNELVLKKLINETTWIEVFVDILLSMYTKRQQIIRTILKKVYLRISKYMNVEALKLMLQVLEDADEEDDEDDEDMSDASSDDGSDKEQEEEEEENESDNEVDKNSNANEELRQAVEKALGDAAAKEDDDDVEMDDEAMLRLDPLIAEAFRSQMKKSSTIKINEKLHHQLRVLDLIEFIIKKDERMNFVTISIRPLIDKCVSIPNTAAYRPMIVRLNSILRHLSSRKIGHSDMVKLDDCLELFHYLAAIQGGKTKLLTDVLTKVSMFVIKLCLHVGTKENKLDDVQKDICSTYEEGISRFFESTKPLTKKNKQKNGEIEDANEDMEEIQHPLVHPTTIKEFFQRFPEYSTQLALSFVQRSLKDDVTWKKRLLVCGILNNFFNKTRLNNVDPILLNTTIELIKIICQDSKSSKQESLNLLTMLTQKLLFIKEPQLTPEQAQLLFSRILAVIERKTPNNPKQKQQLVNLLNTFKKRYQLEINDNVMSMLKKRKQDTVTNGDDTKKVKKLKTTNNHMDDTSINQPGTNEIAISTSNGKVKKSKKNKQNDTITDENETSSKKNKLKKNVSDSEEEAGLNECRKIPFKGLSTV